MTRHSMARWWYRIGPPLVVALLIAVPAVATSLWNERIEYKGKVDQSEIDVANARKEVGVVKEAIHALDKKVDRVLTILEERDKKGG